jgi:dethiobiotin synthetase
LRLAGWVATRLDPAMLAQDANLAALAGRLAAPCLGVMPHCADPVALAHTAWLRADALVA